MAPRKYTTGGGGAHCLAAEETVALSLRRADIRDGVLGGKPADEASVEAGRRETLGESCAMNDCSDPKCWRRTREDCLTAVPVGCGRERWLNRVRVDASVMRGAVTNTRGGDSSGSVGRGQYTTIVTKLRQFVTAIVGGAGSVAFCLFLALALVLST